MSVTMSHASDSGTRNRTRAAPSPDLLPRLVVTVLLVIFASTAATVLLLALGLLPPSAVVSVFAPIGDVLRSVPAADVADRGLIAGAAALLGVCALALIAWAPRAIRRRMVRHVLDVDEKGLIVIGTESVETVALISAIKSAGVLDARVSVSGRSTGPVRVAIRVDALPGTDLKQLGADVRDTVRRNVEQLVGLQVSDARVEVQVAEFEDLIEVSP